ncbi:MAG: phenylalanine--tRNA ligase subunit beta [Candidatus Nanosalina sp.]
MPHIEIDKREFDELIGEKISEDRLREEAAFLGAHSWQKEGDHKWDVETYPDRPDFLSVEGLARAYRGFFGIETGREEYNVEKGGVKLEVDDSVADVRPYIGCAVVRDLELTRKKINGLIQLQEKMHETMGRKRDKLAIGLHDLSTVEPPFTYRAVEPEKVSFTPLEYDRDMQLGEILDEHEKGQKYAWILEDEDRYPVIEDVDSRVLSFPPIINNQLTEVDSGTSDIFIDVTGKDRETVMKCLNILSTALAERGGRIESVEVNGEEMPDLSPEKWILDPDYVREVSGLEISDEEIIKNLEEMKYGAEKKKGSIKVDVPSYRTDIMHEFDLIEDVVIAYRYSEIEPEMPEVDQAGGEHPKEEYTDVLRDILAGTGALEAHTYILSNREDLFDRMEMERNEIVEMSNPLTEEHSVARNWLIPGLMKALEENKHHSYPQEFFEVEDIAVLDDSSTGSSNRRKLAYVASGSDKDFTDVREVLQIIERDTGRIFEVEKVQKSFFKDKRSGEILMQGEKIGVIGEFSEKVQENWDIEYPVAGLEIDVEKMKDIE